MKVGRAQILLLLLSGACGGAVDEPCREGAELAIFHGSAEVPEEAASTAGVWAIGALVDLHENLFCTGTLIHRRWVLSAAHCSTDGLWFSVRHRNGPELKVRLGGVRYHDRADIALIEVLEPETLEAAGVRPLAPRRQPLEDLDLVGRKATLAGLGRTDTGEQGELRFVSEEVVAVDATSITVDGAGTSGACVGDSGGPLLARAPSGQTEVLGTLTAGDSSCLGRDAYLRLDVHDDWIQGVSSLTQEPAMRAACSVR